MPKTIVALLYERDDLAQFDVAALQVAFAVTQTNLHHRPRVSPLRGVVVCAAADTRLSELVGTRFDWHHPSATMTARVRTK